MDEGKRKAFWATAHDLGLSEEETRKALGLGPDDDGEYASTKSYSGTFDDALDAISGYANRKREADIDTEGLPEAPVVIYSQAVSKTGFEMNFTVRGKSWGQAMDLFAIACADITSAGGKPLRNGRYEQAVTTTKAPARETTKSQAPSPPQERKSTPPQAEDGYSNVNTSRLERIDVEPDGAIKLHVDGMKWPLKDHRGPDVVAGLFSEDCWTQTFAPIHLSEPGYYEPEGLFVTYGKSQKGYWDCLSVRRA
jgi:hypothetical protein